MEQIGTPPNVAKFDSKATDSWFRGVTGRMKVYSGTSNPAASEVPIGQWIVYYNTTLNEVRIWTNINGTLKSSAAFT